MPKMSASYKAIFILSIFMVFFVLIAGALSQSKSSGFGVWIWGYTVWLMYKRRTSDLVTFYKGILWVYFIAGFVAIGTLAISNNEVSRIVGYTAFEVLFLFILIILLTYGLYRYFYNLSLNTETYTFIDANSDTQLWEQVSDEIKSGNRVDSLWVRVFSETEGDVNKANARYIKLRAEQIKQEKRDLKSKTQLNSEVINLNLYKKINLLNIVPVLISLIFILSILYLIKPNIFKYYDSIKTNNVTFSESQKVAQNAPISKTLSCQFIWNFDLKTFDRVNDIFTGYASQKTHLMPKTGLDLQVADKIQHLRDADIKEEVVLAKALAKEIDSMVIRIYYNSYLSPTDFINSNTQALLSARCLQ